MTADPAAERIDAHLDAVDAAADWQPEPGDDDDAGPDVLTASYKEWAAWRKSQGWPCDTPEYFRVWALAFEHKFGAIGDRAPF